MFWAVLDGDVAAVGTDQLFGFEGAGVLGFVHCLSAVLSTTEIWVFTFEAFEVSVNGHRILVLLLKIWRFRVFELLVFITAFKL